MKAITLNRNNVISILFIFLLLCISSLVFTHDVYAQSTAEPIGKITKLKGEAYIVNEAAEKRAVRIGASVFELDTVFTEKDSSLTIIFNDKTQFELSAESSLKANEYKYKQDVEQDSVTLSVLKGTFRFVTGLVAKDKPEAMEVNTAVATIGIRGTQVIGEADATSATIILIEPEDETRKTAIDVYNEFGKVHIDEPGFGTEIPDQYSPPSPPQRMRLQTINNLMRSMQSINRVNVPRPRVP